MPRKGANVTLSSYDEIFTTEEGRTERDIPSELSMTMKCRKLSRA